ncbi:Retrovirus-related Pol polyprotein from transposon TNT 1-94 [Vitis vinifera]|uniref:Retrovirus-related Pol polyprotein from transposon TNT 1-94 n=1 Tax=Vitis vinifera TaxID=29760 RepID=A0A438J8D8_VITVI|nr:Retrovirus-related Pol polyprotein from transposon TNT 1-94 [Vitis vinifera]
MELWFMRQGYEDHLVTPEDVIPDAKGLYTNDIQRFYKVVSDIVHVRQQDMDLFTYIGRIASLKEEFLTFMPFTNGAEAQQIQVDKFFMVLTLIGLRQDLESVRDQILASPSVPSLDDVFARLLHLSSTQTLSTDGLLDSSVLASQTNSRGGRSGNRGRRQRPQCTYCNKFGHTQDCCYQLHGRPPCTAHIAQSSNPLVSRRDSTASSTSQSITLIGSDYDAYLRYQIATSTSVAQTGNVSVCFTQSPSLGPWILDSGAFDHISGIGLAHPLPSLPLHFDMSTGKTIGIGRESQGLYPSHHLHLLQLAFPPMLLFSFTVVWGHPSLSKFQKMIPRFSTLSSFALTMLGNIFLHPLLLLCPNMGSSISHLVLILLNKMGLLNDKLFAKATKCIFLGYSRLQKGYRCYSPDTHRYFLSADVTFFEDSPFFSSSESLPIFEVLPLSYISPPPPFRCALLSSSVYRRRHRAITPSLFSAEVPDDSPPVPPISPTLTLSSTDHLPIALRKSNRSTRNPHPIYNFLSYHQLSSSYFVFVSTLSSISLPKSTSETLSHPGWQQAMVDEMVALHSNGTWDLVSLPLGKSTIGCCWVYTVKVGPDGQVDRLKARLVAKGYTQIYGCDYGDTFSPVAKIVYVCLFLSMTAMCHTQIVDYIDANWAGSPSDRRSTSGYCVFIRGNLISWKSKKQDVGARSSAEAEYRAMALATCELIWLRQLLQELRFGKDEQIKLGCDNQAA